MGGSARGRHDRHPRRRTSRASARGTSRPAARRMPIEGPAIVVASWFAPTGAPIDVGRPGSPTHPPRRHGGLGRTRGRALGAAARARARARDRGWRSCGGPTTCVAALEALLVADCADFRAAPSSGVPEGSLVLGDPADVSCLGAAVEPGVVFDVRHGVVVIDEAVEVRNGTRLEGPVYVGPGTRVLGGFIRGSVFGPECRVRGEIASSRVPGIRATRRTTASSATACSATGSISAPAPRPRT